MPHRGSDHHHHRETYYAPHWSWWSTIFSIISMTCFASWCGIMGLLLSGLSYADHKAGDYKRARYKRSWSWFCAISGIIFTIVAIVLLMLVMFVIDVEKPEADDQVNNYLPPWLLQELNERES